MSAQKERRRWPRERSAHTVAVHQKIYEEWRKRLSPLTPQQRLIARDLRQRLGLIPAEAPLSEEDRWAALEVEIADELAKVQAYLASRQVIAKTDA